MKEKIINKVKKELDKSDSFFFNETELIIQILSDTLDKYLVNNDNSKNIIEEIKQKGMMIYDSFH